MRAAVRRRYLLWWARRWDARARKWRTPYRGVTPPEDKAARCEARATMFRRAAETTTEGTGSDE